MTIEELIKHYQALVNAQDELAQCCSTYNEAILRILVELTEDYYNRSEDSSSVYAKLMKFTRGSYNPNFVIDAIEQWKSCE